MYYWKKMRFGFPMFVKDEHPMALYAGKTRLSPGPYICWWFPTNWLAIAAILVIALVSYPVRFVLSALRGKGAPRI